MDALPWCYPCSTFVQNRIVLTTMKRMLNRMLRYADVIVKRGVDKLIDAIGHSPEPQTKNAETPQPQRSMGNDTDCAPQTTGSTTSCDLTEQTITLKDELYAVRDWSTARCTSLAAAAAVTRCSLPSSVRCRLNVMSFFPSFYYIQLYLPIFAACVLIICDYEQISKTNRRAARNQNNREPRN